MITKAILQEGEWLFLIELHKSNNKVWCYIEIYKDENSLEDIDYEENNREH